MRADSAPPPLSSNIQEPRPIRVKSMFSCSTVSIFLDRCDIFETKKVIFFVGLWLMLIFTPNMCLKDNKKGGIKFSSDHLQIHCIFHKMCCVWNKILYHVKQFFSKFGQVMWSGFYTECFFFSDLTQYSHVRMKEGDKASRYLHTQIMIRFKFLPVLNLIFSWMFAFKIVHFLWSVTQINLNCFWKGI